MSFLFYKRPQYVLKRNEPLVECTSRRGNAQDCSSAAIPRELSFEKVVCNKCLPPCSLQDFVNYLTYISHDVENLQFYLWMVDYYYRFRNAPKAEKALSSRWRPNQPHQQRPNDREIVKGKEKPALDARDLDLHSEDIASGSTWNGTHSMTTDDCTHTVGSSKSSPPATQHGGDSNPRQSQTSPQIQPFRAEINKIVTHYLAPGSPRQLNLSHKDRATVLRALEHTTHPSALTVVKRTLDSTLRNQSHPNFIRWSICNGNKRWTYALQIFAITNVMIGFGIAVALTLSKYARWWRIFAAIEWWFGITNMITASRGLCVLLHRLHTRQYHAWETKGDSDDDEEAMLKGLDIGSMGYESTKSKWPVRMEVFGPANSYSDEPWVHHYARKSWVSNLFERRVGVQEPGLKTIQNRMTRQAEAWAFLITIPLTVGAVAIPKGNLYPSSRTQL